MLSCSYCAPPFDGKYRYLADGTSDERDNVYQHLFIHDFRDTRPTDLPNGILITIINPKSEFRQVNFAKIRKVDDRSELIIVLCFDYPDWHLPVSLPLFAESYCEALNQQVEGAIQSDIEHSDIGLFISCAISVPPSTNFWSAYQKANGQILSVYRKCLADIYKRQHQPTYKAQPLGDESSGAKWWFRYVIVPVLGSGAVAAVAAGLVALWK